MSNLEESNGNLPEEEEEALTVKCGWILVAENAESKEQGLFLNDFACGSANFPRKRWLEFVFQVLQGITSDEKQIGVEIAAILENSATALRWRIAQCSLIISFS